jgi:lysophospholipase L1-like esterase
MGASAALLALASAATQPGAAPACSGNLCGGEALQPLFEALEARRSFPPRAGAAAGGPVHIVHLGDSHTAGDMITGALRDNFQLGYGHGGRGVLPPGRPWPGYLTWGVTAAQSSGWNVASIFGRGYSARGRPVGLSGYTLTGAAPGARLAVAADDEANRFDRMIVCALKEPGAGAVTLSIGGRSERWLLDSPRHEPECRALDADGLVEEASVTKEDARPVGITSFATFRRGGGVAYSNLGVSGSQLVHQGRQHEAIVRAELQAYRPDLIVLAFGTNEGFAPRFSAAAYEGDLRNQIARIRRLSGREVPILIVGAPDAGTRNAALAANGGVPGRSCGNGVLTPGALGQVRDVQRRVAAELGLAFWDWYQAMGGACSAARWTARGLMRGDLVHFSRSGGAEIGRLLFRDLVAAGPAPAPSFRPL